MCQRGIAAKPYSISVFLSGCRFLDMFCYLVNMLNGFASVFTLRLRVSLWTHRRALSIISELYYYIHYIRVSQASTEDARLMTAATSVIPLGLPKLWTFQKQVISLQLDPRTPQTETCPCLNERSPSIGSLAMQDIPSRKKSLREEV